MTQALQDDHSKTSHFDENDIATNEADGVIQQYTAKDGMANPAMIGYQQASETKELESQDITRTRTEDTKPYSAFSPSQKWFIVGMASAAAFFSPLSGQIYFPVLPILAESYDLSQSLINISVTTYMVFQGLAPSFMAAFSDATGRRLGYVLAFTIYTAANIGLALQNSYAALLVLRCVQSAGSSGTVAFGYGVVADVATTAERGKYFGPMLAGALLAPAFGPVIGGLLTQLLGWRSVFWFLTIISGGYLAIFIVFMPETSRKLVDDGSIVPANWWQQSVMQWLAARRQLKAMSEEERLEYLAQQRMLATNAPRMKWRSLSPLGSVRVLGDLDALCIILFNGVAMFCNLILMTSVATEFGPIYGLNVLEVGLCFLPLGFAALFASIMNGKILDWNYARHARKLGVPVDKKRLADLSNFPIEACRLKPVFYVQVLSVATLLPFGWALEKHASIAVPLVLEFMQGFCMIVMMNSMGTLLADIYPGRATTASAASNLVRCLLGAVGASTVSEMIKAWGLGWTFVFTGFLMGSATVLLMMEKRFGMRWRQNRWTKQGIGKPTGPQGG